MTEDALAEFFRLFTLTVVLAGQPQGYDPATLGPKVVYIGDSNVGTTVGAELARRASLRDKPWRLIVHSVSGSGMFNTAYWVPHARALCNAEQPALVIFNLGTNDAGSGEFPSRWPELPALAYELAANCPMARVVFVGVPPDYAPWLWNGVEFVQTPLPGQAAWLNQYALPYAAGTAGGLFVPVDAGWVGADGVHYTELGGRALGARVYEAGRVALGEYVGVTE